MKQKILALTVMFFYTLAWLMFTGWVKSFNVERSQIPFFIGLIGAGGLILELLPIKFGNESVGWSLAGFVVGILAYLIIVLIWLPSFLLYLST